MRHQFVPVLLYLGKYFSQCQDNSSRDFLTNRKINQHMLSIKTVVLFSWITSSTKINQHILSIILFWNSIHSSHLEGNSRWAATGSMDHKLIVWDIQHSLPRCTCEHEVCWGLLKYMTNVLNTSGWKRKFYKHEKYRKANVELRR